MNEKESEDKPFVPSHRQRPLGTDKDAQQKSYERKIKNLRLDMAETFGNPAGQRVLKYLFESSGFGQSNVAGNASLGLDVKDGTFYNAARENLYIEMRKLIPHSILKQVEFDNMEELT